VTGSGIAVSCSHPNAPASILVSGLLFFADETSDATSSAPSWRLL
jgi:hypothetical protein